MNWLGQIGKNSQKKWSNWKYNYKQDKMLSDWEIKKLQKSWLDIHDIKKYWGGRSKMDLFKNSNWEIYIKRKTWRGTSDIEYIWENIKNF